MKTQQQKIKEEISLNKKKEFDEIIETAKRILNTGDCKKYKEMYIALKDKCMEGVMNFSPRNVRSKELYELEREKMLSELRILDLLLKPIEKDARMK